MLFAFCSCEKALYEPQPGNDPESIFEDLWQTFKQDYANFDERNVDWQQEYSTYRPMVNENTTNDELYEVLTQLLATLNDGHVELNAPGRKIFKSNIYMNEEERNGLFDLDLIKSNYMNNGFAADTEDINTYGLINNVGYWHMLWIHENLLSTDKILAKFKDANGLIIDLRNNGGGDMTYSFSELGRLTDTEVFTHRSKTKNGPGEDDYTAWYNWNLHPRGSYFDKPIILITDRYTLSAAERTCMILKSLPNVTHIGETTNGGHSTKVGKELANGWFYSIAPQKIEFRDGQSYEGIGLIPDIEVMNTSSDIQSGRDKVLERALEEIN